MRGIAFNPFTRVDVRRMHKLGVLGDDELYVSYLDVGYDADKAEKMAQFTIAFNAEAETSLTKSQIINGFSDYILTRAEALEFLDMLGFASDEAAFLLTFEEYKRETELSKTIIKSAEKRYLLSLATEAETRDRLTALNLTASKITVLMEALIIKKYDQIKIPSKVELARFLKSEIITEEIYIAEMLKLNYTTKYISWYQQEIKKVSRKELYNDNQG